MQLPDTPGVMSNREVEGSVLCFCQTPQCVHVTPAWWAGALPAGVALLPPSPPAITMGHHTGLDHRTGLDHGDRTGGDHRTSEEVGGPLSRAQGARTLENLTHGDKGVAVSTDETGRGSAMDNQRLKVTRDSPEPTCRSVLIYTGDTC